MDINNNDPNQLQVQNRDSRTERKDQPKRPNSVEFANILTQNHTSSGTGKFTPGKQNQSAASSTPAPVVIAQAAAQAKASGSLKTKSSANTAAGANATSTTGASESSSSTSDANNTSAILLEQTQRMQEMNQSFNLQYLQLQENMQADNRQFTTISNVSKTKHDTSKNSIGNIR